MCVRLVVVVAMAPAAAVGATPWAEAAATPRVAAADLGCQGQQVRDEPFML